MRGKKRAYKRRRKQVFSTGQLNRLVDSFCHPLYKVDKRFLLLDGFLHGLIERNPPETVQKFLRYNLAEIMKEFSEERLE
jgi:hypothetical protein